MDLIDKLIDNLISTDSAKICDDALKENAEFAGRAGLEVRVTRVYDGIGLSNDRVCEWCKARECRNVTLADAYEIGAFQRHPGCECIIEYTSLKGEKTYQSGKSGPRGWISEAEFQNRINFGLDKRRVTPQERTINAAIEMQIRDKKSTTLIDAIIENHEALKYYTPEGMKERLEKAGFKVIPLGKRSKHIPGLEFEKGGGYRVLFGGDGYIQYHPAGGAHKIKYWKINNGERRVHKYDMEGNEVFF